MNTADALANLGITSLSPMQQQGVELIRHNSEAILIAPTGSGKTLCFLLPLVEQIDKQSDQVEAIILTPTRELALQTFSVLQNMKTGIRACCCYGGRPTMDEHRSIKAIHPHIIIGTPGRINDHLDKENFSPTTIKTAIVDEYDKMFEMKFIDEVERIFLRMTQRQRCTLISATQMADMSAFAGFLHHKPATLLWDTTGSSASQPKIENFIVQSPTKDKLVTLDALLRSLGRQQAVVFANYREAVERIGHWLIEQGHSVSLFHGGMEQADREKALSLFKNGSANILVSTDLSARGIDIPALENVVHYHLPQSAEGYIHRSGRSGRWERSGRSFVILGPEEDTPEVSGADFAVYNIPANLPAPAKPLWKTIYIGRGKKDKLSKGDIVGFFCKTGGINNNDLGQIDIHDHYAYVAIKSDVTRQVLHNIGGEKIKKMSTKIEQIRYPRISNFKEKQP